MTASHGRTQTAPGVVLSEKKSVRSRDIDLVGAFYAVGITGHPQFKVVTLWDCHGGTNQRFTMTAGTIRPVAATGLCVTQSAAGSPGLARAATKSRSSSGTNSAVRAPDIVGMWAERR